MTSAGAGEDPVRLDVRVAVGSCCKCCAEQGGPGIVVVGAQGSKLCTYATFFLTACPL